MTQEHRTSSAVAPAICGGVGAACVAVAAGLVYLDMRMLSLLARPVDESFPETRVVVALVVGAIGSALFAGACVATCWRCAQGLTHVGLGLRGRADAAQPRKVPNA